MTLGELREAYRVLMESLKALRELSTYLGIELDLDLSEEWAFIVRDEAIYLEYQKDVEVFKVLIKGDDIRDAMYKVIDKSNNEDQA